jgi:hypothetical protein
MDDKLVRAYGKSFMRRMLFSLLVGGLLIACLACLLIGLAIVPENILSQEIKPFVLGATLVLFFSTAIGATILWVVSRNRQLYAQLDAAFTPLGLAGSRYLLTGRQYRGTFHGRTVHVYYHVSGGRSLRTPDLVIYIQGNFRTRLGLGSENVLTSAGGALLGRTPLELNEPAYEGILIYPLDETWSRSLLTAPHARKAVARLVGQNTHGLRALVFSPISVYLQIRHFDTQLIAPHTVRAWVDDLIGLAETAEGLSPPTKTAQASDLELVSQSNRAKFVPIALGIVALMIICPLLIVITVFLTLFLFGVFP